MRAFIISLLLLTLIFGSVAVNSSYVTGISDEMLSICSALPTPLMLCSSSIPDCEAQLDRLSVLWNRSIPLLSMTVGYDYICTVTNSLNEARASLQTGSTTDFAIAASALREALIRLNRLEKFSLDNVI